MNATWRDMISSVLAIFGGVVVFAKLQAYDWWLIGSWKGALGVLAVTGLAIALTNTIELVKYEDDTSLSEAFLWAIAGSFTVVSLIVATTKAEFITSAALVGIAWVAQTTRHLWRSAHGGPIDSFGHAH